MKVTFDERALDDYQRWADIDKRVFKRINALIRDIQRQGFVAGIGKPEPLRHRKGFSRRIDDAHRLVYGGDENGNLEIISCKGHYED